MAVAWTKRAALRTGYGAVIAVLVLSAIEAYRIQVSVSQQHLEIYRRFVEQDEALSTLRRNLWLAGNRVRDFFIDPTPSSGDELSKNMLALQAENDRALRVLAGYPRYRSVVPQLRASLGEFWAVVEPLPRTMLHATREEEMGFLAREVVPRRGELYNALRDLTLADQRMLQDSQGEFAGTRRRAAGRLLLMLGVGLLLSILVARLSLRHAENLEREADRHFAEVEQTRGELQRLSARLLEIEEEGRRRLSRELHDEIGQTLALLQIELSRAQAFPASPPAALREHLDRAHALAERTVQTIRNISGLLRPALLDDLGLVPALQFQLEDFLRRSGIVCEFVEEGVADYLPDPVKTCVYRVVQEALHNCEKHSGARKVRVSVRQFPEALVAEIEDDGTGFQMNDQHRPVRSAGFGLLGMRERAGNAGGSLIVDSAPGHGTRIALRIPLAPQPIEART
jgi:signal transduction histidine kinase